MAQIQDRKKDFYSQKQSVRDESLAPTHLETAGDVLVKNLAKKQLETRTTLREQLMVQQNFETGFELTPDRRQGVASLEELKNEAEETAGTSKTEMEKESVKVPLDISSLMKTTGLTRHELELSLCEKPNSAISKLYKFALANKRDTNTVEKLEEQLPHHPINRLAEIEEEYFGHLREGKDQSKEKDFTSDTKAHVSPKNKLGGQRKRKHRKRRKKQKNAVEVNESLPSSSKMTKTSCDLGGSHVEPEIEERSCRPSLWDVKDMKKWSQPKKFYGCKPQTLYTIKDGKIVKLEKLDEDEDMDEGVT
ncbi:hypothetical protein RUM43_006113 [Polyplax serrata]|uniref:Uncharacterized protein n=1 Tax=Polyplax serrata TaxID=468196 RepID=A0AAN8PEF8_POLSC